MIDFFTILGLFYTLKVRVAANVLKLLHMKMGIRDAHFRGCLFSLDTGPSLGRSWVKIRLTSTFDLQLWVVMNIINEYPPSLVLSLVPRPHPPRGETVW